MAINLKKLQETLDNPENIRKWKEEYGHIPYSPGDPTY